MTKKLIIKAVLDLTKKRDHVAIYALKLILESTIIVDADFTKYLKEYAITTINKLSIFDLIQSLRKIVVNPETPSITRNYAELVANNLDDEKKHHEHIR